MRILIVDDERLVRYSLRSMLEAAGRDRFEVREAANAEEMLREIANQVPDIALVDIRMPGPDGISAIEDVPKAERNSVDWIILTAQQEFSAAQRALRLGVRDYLLKPVDPDSLLRQIETIEEERLPPAAKTVLTDNPVVQAVITWTETHLGGNVGLAQAADAQGLTPNYLSTLFREQTGITYTQFLTRSRLEVARELLTTEPLTVREVAKRVGYQSHRNFARRFHAHFGSYPSEVRRSGPPEG